MNTKRIIFWTSFIIILALIIWGLVVAMNKPTSTGPKLGVPSAVTSADHVRGNASSSVTVIEYSDFQCPACRIAYPMVEKLITEASTTMLFVYRHFPLYPLPHKNANLAAYASEAASAQGKFWEMYHKLFDNQTDWENSDTPTTIFEGYAKDLGLDVVAYKKVADSTETKSRVERDRTEGDNLGVSGTPTFFVNGKAIVTPQNYDAFKAIIDAAAKAATK
jgi:protein-disulfide isomerase